jgi:hypothetical protein
MAPTAAGTERAHCGGVSLARLQANSEGPRRGTSQLGRSRRSFGPQRAGASKVRTAAHPRGKKDTSPEGYEEQRLEVRGAKETPRSGKKATLASREARENERGKGRRGPSGLQAPT